MTPFVPLEPAQLGAGLEIPQPQRPIVGPRERAPPVGQHRHAGDPALVPLEPAQLGAGLEIPQPQRPIPGPRERAPPVGQHRHAGDPVLVPLEAAQLGAGLEIPQPQRPSSGPRERAPPVGQHRHAGDPASCPSNRRSSAPVSRSHSRSVLSQDPESARRPSASTVTLVTPSSCPSNRRSSAPGGVKVGRSRHQSRRQEHALRARQELVHSRGVSRREAREELRRQFPRVARECRSRQGQGGANQVQRGIAVRQRGVVGEQRLDAEALQLVREPRRIGEQRARRIDLARAAQMRDEMPQPIDIAQPGKTAVADCLGNAPPAGGRAPRGAP